MKTHGLYSIHMNGAEPEVLQAQIGRFQLTWNPDDGRYYVEDIMNPASVAATFKEYRNAVFYAKKHG